ncbi:Uu.00g074840.m01.CDS01 [Anthostomella pinea]|uniref:Uu.00g074840.m01.CDS01 n=1 Tax=Anthostomella pinea TaxID=933095 RepID=A0AAI8VVK0_9PEZI|nr:Uu.00g074840.m01.CDS01 [Anthostomella pinea]
MDAYECDNCGIQPEEDDDPDLSRCNGCKIAYYCDRTCQKEHWPEHKAECKDPEWRAANARFGEAKEKKAARRRETRKAWDARVNEQPSANTSWAVFQRRARKRKGNPLEYRRADMPGDQVLRFDDKNVLEAGKFMKEITKVVFAPGMGLTDSDVDTIMTVDLDVRSGIRVFVAGDPLCPDKKTVALDVTDAGVKKLCQALPNLEVVKLMSTRKLGGRAFPEIILGCHNIEAVTITAQKGSKANLDEGDFLNELIDKEYRTKLRYLDFRGVHLNREHHNFLRFLTKRRPALEIVFQDGQTPAVLFRDMNSVPLSKVPKQTAKKEGDDDDSESGDKSDEEAREKRRRNARALELAGRRHALSDALGRPLYEGEMDYDSGQDELSDPDDDGIDDEEYAQMMAIFRQMDGFDDEEDDDDYYY